MKNTIHVILLLAALWAGGFGCISPKSHKSKTADNDAYIGQAKFAPPLGKVIIFAGQDNASVGGNAHFDDGYVDNVDVPGGITHYVGMGADRTNQFKTSFDDSHIDGLYTESEWGAGPMCMKYYVDSPILDNCIIHLSISLTGNNEDKAADGSHDYLIEELIRFLSEYEDTPFLIRIGYEFDGPWNHYDPENFKGAFRRIVDKLRRANVINFASVMASASIDTPYQTWEQYYPGDQYVDWVGYSYWGGSSADSGTLRFARDQGKPVFIAESTPRGRFLDTEDGRQVWEDWFVPFFQHVHENLDVIRAVSYINCNWDAQPMWQGQNWGNSRIETNDYIRKEWLEKMQDPMFINVEDNPFQTIGFTPKRD